MPWTNVISMKAASSDIIGTRLNSSRYENNTSLTIIFHNSEHAKFLFWIIYANILYLQLLVHSYYLPPLCSELSIRLEWPIVFNRPHCYRPPIAPAKSSSVASYRSPLLITRWITEAIFSLLPFSNLPGKYIIKYSRCLLFSLLTIPIIHTCDRWCLNGGIYWLL